MSIEGCLEVVLHQNGRGDVRSEIASSRPLDISTLFVGKTPSMVLPLISSLYSVCGMAQSCASVAACEQAMGLDVPASTKAARQLVVWAETAREHVLRIALDWGQGAQASNLKNIMLLAQNIKSIFTNVFEIGIFVTINKEAVLEQIIILEEHLETVVFGESLEFWQQRKNTGAVADWAGGKKTRAACMIADVLEKDWHGIGGNGAIPGLPALDDEDLLLCLKEPGFIAEPSWQGIQFETTPLSRQIGNELIDDIGKKHGFGLMARLAALLVELSVIPSQMRDLLENPRTISGPNLGDGFGLAQLEAARGRLAHAVELESGIVSQYWILAPTEWNFHPCGPAAKALDALAVNANGDLQEQARLLISAIDPCVSFDVRTA